MFTTTSDMAYILPWPKTDVLSKLGDTIWRALSILKVELGVRVGGDDREKCALAYLLCAYESKMQRAYGDADFVSGMYNWLLSYWNASYPGEDYRAAYASIYSRLTSGGMSDRRFAARLPYAFSDAEAQAASAFLSVSYQEDSGALVV